MKFRTNIFLPLLFLNLLFISQAFNPFPTIRRITCSHKEQCGDGYCCRFNGGSFCSHYVCAQQLKHDHSDTDEDEEGGGEGSSEETQKEKKVNFFEKFISGKTNTLFDYLGNRPNNQSMNPYYNYGMPNAYPNPPQMIYPPPNFNSIKPRDIVTPVSSTSTNNTALPESKKLILNSKSKPNLIYKPRGIDSLYFSSKINWRRRSKKRRFQRAFSIKPRIVKKSENRIKLYQARLKNNKKSITLKTKNNKSHYFFSFGIYFK